MSNPRTDPARWWEEEGLIDLWIAGVFEGGGAKGAAYAGALRALLERRCWFRAVAGASAGAITAALVAGGLRPREIEGRMPEVLDALAVETGKAGWRAARRLRIRGGLYSKDGLREWLQACLEEAPGRRVTFASLFARTGIELNVVAANLSTRSQIVFNHRQTPHCDVVEAVLASASIPFAFEEAELVLPSSRVSVELKGGSRTLYRYQTIVDGGVWSNFPMFVFTDRAFRRWSRRHVGLERERYDRVVGFHLDESAGHEAAGHEDVIFAPPRDKSQVSIRDMVADWDEGDRVPSEWASGRGGEKAYRKAEPSSTKLGLVRRALGRIGSGVLLFVAMLARLGRALTKGEIGGRWPPPEGPTQKRLFDVLDGSSSAVTLPLWGVGAWIVLGLAAWKWAIGFLPEQFAEAVVQEPGAEVVDVIFDWVFGFAGGGLLVILVFLLLLASLTGIALNYYLSKAARRVGYGLVTTYFAGPGAPQWTRFDERVVSLDVGGVGTMDFDIVRWPSQEIDGEETTPLRHLISKARRATLERLSTYAELQRDLPADRHAELLGNGLAATE